MATDIYVGVGGVWKLLTETHIGVGGVPADPPPGLPPRAAEIWFSDNVASAVLASPPPKLPARPRKWIIAPPN